MFNCSPNPSQALGYYAEVFTVNSSNFTAGSNITVDCNVTASPPRIALMAMPNLVPLGDTVNLVANITDRLNVTYASVQINGTNYSMMQVSPTANSVATLFYDGFESGSVASMGWVLNGTRYWLATNDAPENGTYEAEMQGGAGKPSFMEIDLSTSGYQNIVVSYYRQLVNLGATDSFSVQYYNGTAWTTLDSKGGVTENDTSYTYENFALPANASNLTVFDLRFSCTSAASLSESCRVDEVRIMGSSPSASLNYWVYPYQTLASGTYNLTVYANDTSGNLTPATGNFTVFAPNVTLSEDPINASGSEINLNLEIDSLNNTVVYNQTNASQHVSLQPGSYYVKIKPNLAAISQVVIPVNVTSDLPSLVDIDQPAAKSGFGRQYALRLNYPENAIVSMNPSQGNAVFTCTSWDFVNENCTGTWQKVQDIPAGQPYNLTVSSTGVFAYGEDNQSIVLTDPGGNLVYSNQTILSNSSGLVNLSIATSNALISNMTIYGYNYLAGQYDLKLTQSSSAQTAGMGFRGNSRMYSVDASGMNFTNATITIANSTGNPIYKCQNWDFTSQTCIDGNWTLFKNGSAAGQPYSVSIYPGDPGFAEIAILSAEELDQNRNFIADIYPEVSMRDYVYQMVPAGDYVRVVFQTNLTATNDIKIFATSNYSNASVQVYNENGNATLADFGNITSDGMYDVLLSNLSGMNDTFDLQVSGNPVYFDYIVDPPWSNNSYDSCINITIINASRTAQTNFPVFINLTYNSSMLANYQDLIFYSAACTQGGTILPFEIENYTAANAIIWVGIPTLNAANTTISVYYKNNTPVSSMQNVTGVWNSNFMAVWHMNSTSPSDSTSHANNGVAKSSNVSINYTGKIDSADNFVAGNGNNSYINCSNSSSLHTSGNLTVSAWVNSRNNQTADAKIVSKAASAFVAPWNEYGLSLSAATTVPKQYMFEMGFNTTLVDLHSTSNYTANGWDYVAGVYNGTAMLIYVNGALQNTTTVGGSINLSTAALLIGGWPYTLTQGWNGTIDEVEISNASFNAQWINQSYQMENNNANWVKFGAAMSRPIVSATLNSPAANAVINTTSVTFNWTCTGSSSSFTANLTIDGAVNVSAIASTNNTATTQTVTGFTLGSHTWSVTCIDPNNNSISTASRAFTVAVTPVLTSINLNSTSGSNYTWDNLTCNYNLNSSTASTAAVAWYRNGTPAMILYLPMQGNSSNALLDYSGRGHNATNFNGTVWNSTGGYDGNGSFQFNGSSYLTSPIIPTSIYLGLSRLPGISRSTIPM